MPDRLFNYVLGAFIAVAIFTHLAVSAQFSFAPELRLYVFLALLAFICVVGVWGVFEWLNLVPKSESKVTAKDPFIPPLREPVPIVEPFNETLNIATHASARLIKLDQSAFNAAARSRK